MYCVTSYAVVPVLICKFKKDVTMPRLTPLSECQQLFKMK